MKLTESKLKQMIKEVLNEVDQPPTSIPMPPDSRFPMPQYQGRSPLSRDKDMDVIRAKLNKIEMMLKAIIKFHRITDNVPKP